MIEPIVGLATKAPARVSGALSALPEPSDTRVYLIPAALTAAEPDGKRGEK